MCGGKERNGANAVEEPKTWGFSPDSSLQAEELGESCDSFTRRYPASVSCGVQSKRFISGLLLYMYALGVASQRCRLNKVHKHGFIQEASLSVYPRL